MALQHIRRGAAAVAVAGLGTVLVACGATAPPPAQSQMLAAAGAPMSVVCEPNQRAIVRQVVVNGVVQAQAECSSAGAAPVATFGGPAPVAYGAAPSAQPIAYGYSQAAIPETQLIRTAPARAPERVVYQPARQREIVTKPKRSVTKSAVIIGSSAGVGAGIGAAVGGKKGAGIGALIGGGGAALWDQITRRQ